MEVAIKFSTTVSISLLHDLVELSQIGFIRSLKMRWDKIRECCQRENVVMVNQKRRKGSGSLSVFPISSYDL
jgi:hypothetical protein